MTVRGKMSKQWGNGGVLSRKHRLGISPLRRNVLRYVVLKLEVENGVRSMETPGK
jgi:hypothetical protein